jgi:UDP-2-acetamido-3-amino-2,3-dideoxy-glucuronate N-acetyltransferase
MFTEIGADVTIGNGTRIGAQCFIPENVIIGDDVFIGPKVCFTNDKYPPAGKECWGFTYVEDHAAIGAGSIILPNICIGSKALVGAGSVVTKSIPPGEVWCGNPAKFVRKMQDIDGLREELANKTELFK